MKRFLSAIYHVVDIHSSNDGKKPEFIDLLKLSKDQLFEYVIPFYYQDLAWHDRENLRNDDELMKQTYNNGHPKILDNIGVAITRLY